VSISNQIVNVEQPYIRLIVRGKARFPAEVRREAINQP